MKKIILALLVVVISFGIFSCNNDGSNLNIDEKEFIIAPTNLTISGKLLSWDLVENAKGYIVFANGEEVDTVKITSYDFSDLDGDRIVFQVKTEAPRGMQDSPFSASFAYVKDKDYEIQNVSNILSEYNLTKTDELAEELVNKGMLSTDVNELLTEFDSFISESYESDDYIGVYNALNDLLSKVDNVEALVSALVKVYFPTYLDMYITSLEENISYYNNLKEQYPNMFDYYQTMIDDTQNTLDTYNEVKELLNSNPDKLVLSITSTLDYFVSVESLMTESLVETLLSLSDVDNVSNLNASELEVANEEMVNVLRETMPSQEDMILIYQLYDIVLMLSGSETSINEDIDNYTGKMAIKTLYSLEAFINFLDSLDENYFENVVSDLKNESTIEMGYTEAAILTISYYNDFRDDNESLLNNISNVFTDDEKELLYNDYTDMVENLNDSSLYSLSMSFQDLLILQTTFEDAFDKMLDVFVERDGELLRLYVIVSEYKYDFESQNYKNDILDKTYQEFGDYTYDKELDTIKFLKELTYILQGGFKEVDSEDYHLFVPFITNILSDYLVNLNEVSYESINYNVLETLISAFVENSGDMQFDLIDNLLNYLIDEKVFDDFYTLEVNIKESNLEEVQEDGEIIFWLGVYDDFMNSNNKELLDDIITEFFNELSQTNNLNGLNLTAEQVNIIETNVNDFFEYISENSDTILEFDYTNLSTSDSLTIDAFNATLENYLSAISNQLDK